ncbi:MAG TPA: sigma 54-interacting transcriptional regulator [Deltaproteobacteria bacterium]|jgi:transcriptional regulator with GAF, ATPase, and Fis domain|nr:sigma 54-interacting transcriptional regulator [Deltaproteobacteria bacterium]HIJ75737.1 sigma 54-interacting transcriptional regulator [Deltaproteobacteria bacterium]
MKLDENEFFRQATLRICSSLDIEKALFNCLQYIRLFMPASLISLGLFEPSTGVLRSLAIVDHAGSKKSVPPTQLSREAIQEIEADEGSRDVRVLDRGLKPSVVKILRPYIDLSNHSALALGLEIEDKRLGTFAILAEGKARFTKAHVHMMSLLREPFAIAMSNALRYEEVVKLKDIVDAENRELSRELRHFSGDEIVGAEYGLKATMEMVRQVAPLNSPVLLLGETGVGKEVVANAIHYTSSSRGGPFIKVNCGAIPENLLDSELFGHEKGAFTGAITQKRGRFERADKGSIFLDEIGELPLQAQVRLLRVLQHKEIERVGGTKSIPVDVRIIAATHKSMEEMVRSGAFREDLWFRLDVFPITIPPLRRRKEDIPALVHHFVERKSKDLKIYPPPSVSAEEVERLKAYHWPGNIRELENLIERELIHKRGKEKNGRLTFGHFDVPKKTDDLGMPHDGDRSMLFLNEAMSRHIRQALQISNGKISGAGGAAQLLGTNPNTLRSRMRKLGISFKYRAR